MEEILTQNCSTMRLARGLYVAGGESCLDVFQEQNTNHFMRDDAC